MDLDEPMSADLQQKLADVIRLQLETKADVEVMGRQMVEMATCLLSIKQAIEAHDLEAEQAPALRGLLGRIYRDVSRFRT
jgi:hypothetical protein